MPSLKRMESGVLKETPEGPFFRASDDAIGSMVHVEDFFVAESEHGVVGMLGALPATDRFWYVTHFFVEPGQRGAGVGRGLMNAAAAFHSSSGRKTAIATPNPAAIESYERIGFRPVAMTVQWEHQ